MMGFIYRWRNVATDWSYIGFNDAAAGNPRTYIYVLLRGNRHHTRHLQAAWNKYGEQSFVFEVLAEVDCDNDIEVREVEADWLTNVAGLVCTTPHRWLQFRHWAQTYPRDRAKISLALRGMKRTVWNAGTHSGSSAEPTAVDKKPCTDDRGAPGFNTYGCAPSKDRRSE